MIYLPAEHTVQPIMGIYEAVRCDPVTEQATSVTQIIQTNPNNKIQKIPKKDIQECY